MMRVREEGGREERGVHGLEAQSARESGEVEVVSACIRCRIICPTINIPVNTLSLPSFHAEDEMLHVI